MATSPSPVVTTLAEQERELRIVLRRAISATERDLRRIKGRENVGAIIQREQQTAVLRALHEQLAQLWEAIGHTVTAARHRAAAKAITTMVDYSSVLHRAGLSAGQIRVFTNGETQRVLANIDGITQRVNGGRITLSRQVYRSRQLSSGLVDRYVDQAIARGVSWRDLANGVKGMINPNVRGGVSYAAQRLGRTEVATAFHSVSVDYAQQNQFVTAMQWNLSGSHPRPDECDDLAEHAPFKPEDVPPLPHPQCLCYVTPQTEDPAVFLAQLAAGAFDSFTR